MKKAKIALLIGRFQPFHKGHLYLMKQALKVADNLIIGIGSANIHNENNPLNFETRKKIIKAVVYKEKIEDRVMKIVGLNDFFNDEKWLNNVKEQVGTFDLVIGNNDWTNGILGKAGYEVLRFPYYKRELYEGWRIRKLIREGKKWRERVPDYLYLKFQISNFKFSHVVLGGTFDHFHIGHQTFIKKAFAVGKMVTIAIATEKLYKKKLLANYIEPFSSRKKSVSDFLRKNSYLNRVKLIPFSDFKGGADKRAYIDAIVVSKGTFKNALKINELRKKNKLRPLTIVIVDDVLDQGGKLISSERIRSGKINRVGLEYRNLFKKTLYMPEILREDLRKPLGKVFKTVHQVIKFIKLTEPVIIIAVGDIISAALEKEKITPNVKIVDYRSRRKNIPSRIEQDQLSNLINNPSTISPQSTQAINLAIKKYLLTKKPQTVVIKGEEDLLALPAILQAPLRSLVLYGHWQLGIIGVEVTEKTKEKIVKILSGFR